MKIAIATPAIDRPTWDYTESLINTTMPCPTVFVSVPGYEGVVEARNKAVKWFLNKTDFDYLWFVDQDARWEPGTLTKLVSANKPVVQPLGFREKQPPIPYHYKTPKLNGSYKPDTVGVAAWLQKHQELLTEKRTAILHGEGENAIQETLCISTHCVLIRRDVLEALMPPWFMGYSQLPKWVSEDFYFSERVRNETKFKLYTDLSIVVAHGDRHSVGALDFMIWNHAMDWNSGTAEI